MSSLQLAKLKSGIWFIGIPSFLFGTIDRSVAIFFDDYLSLAKLLQLLVVNFLFVSWIWLKPENNHLSAFQRGAKLDLADLYPELDKTHLNAAHSRMQELQNYHMIHQEFVLPFPFISQIYHLLNLKHLETVHNFSLNNLRVIDVTDIFPTSLGGHIKFMTVLDSPFNLLKIWRQPVVEVDLTLHTLYTVELNIPIYGGKRMVVIFNSFPIRNNMHELIIDIYTDLNWPRPILQFVLHLASWLTVYEDMPYLNSISKKNINSLLSQASSSGSKSMWLYRRFIDLYATRISTQDNQENHKLIEALEGGVV